MYQGSGSRSWPGTAHSLLALVPLLSVLGLHGFALLAVAGVQSRRGGWKEVFRLLVVEESGHSNVQWLLWLFMLSCLAIAIYPIPRLKRRYPLSRATFADVVFLSSSLLTLAFAVTFVGLVVVAVTGASLLGEAANSERLRFGLWVGGSWVVLLPVGQWFRLMFARRALNGFLFIAWGVSLALWTSGVASVRPVGSPLALDVSVVLGAVLLSQALYWRVLRWHFRSNDLICGS